MHALRGETLIARESVIHRIDGRKVTVLVSATPLRGATHDIPGILLVFQDVTTRAAIEQHKNEFLFLAGHELRMPVTVIQGLAEILQILSARQEPLSSTRSKRAIAEIIEQSQRLTGLIEEMLDLTRIENHRLSLHLAPVDIVASVKAAIDSQEIIAHQHHIRLTLYGLPADSRLIAIVDRERLIQIIGILLKNAAHYCPRGSEIDVEIEHTQDQPEEVVLRVKDSGTGIPGADLPYIFERFHHPHNADQTSLGLGVGLYLAKELVTRHQGRIRVESVEGKGSTFFVYLPLHPQRRNMK